ncbi:exonuclease mut-7-like protein [Senna tora]|uniref:Exonuclease mut-7-like protein n=1 Tax=Senna tora TaxID=362788 RepID=A0A834W7H8_9FABA|nr:exonuclease mut-7-like protein [Senna tora]
MDIIHISLLEHQSRFRTYTADIFGTTLTITVTSTPSIVKRWLFSTLYFRRRHLHHLIVGLGVQWTAADVFRRDPPAETLQLCIGRRCLVFQLAHAVRVPTILRRFLMDPRYTFVGFWNNLDKEKLRITNHRVEMRRKPLDLRNFVVGWDGGELVQASRERIVEECLGFRGVTFSEEIGRSEWNTEILSSRQILQASIDPYGQFHVGEDLDLQFVIQRHLQICSEFGLMEFYVEISTHDINIDIENQLSFDYNTHQPTPQTDQTLIPSSSRSQIVGTCQPSTEDLGEFSDEDEYEASVPIRMSHQDKEDDNVWEDVVEEELANFYSQVDVERSRGFTGDFGPRSEDVGELYEGMKFRTKAALRRHVKLYHIKNNCTFVVAKSGSNFEDWRCPKFEKECA